MFVAICRIRLSALTQYIFKYNFLLLVNKCVSVFFLSRLTSIFESFVIQTFIFVTRVKLYLVHSVYWIIWLR